MGGLWVRTKLTPSDLQKEFDDNAKNGRNLAYLKRYLHQGNESVSAIWHDKAPVPFVSGALDESASYAAVRSGRSGRPSGCCAG